MGITVIRKYTMPVTILAGGTQYVSGVLAFENPTYITLDESVFSQSGTYVLFDYSNGSFPGGQSEIDACLKGNVSMAGGSSSLSTVDSIQDDPNNSRILVTLASNAANGKQFISGDLNIEAGAQLVLGSDVYASRGTYDLFEVTGTITGLENLVCVSQKGFNVTVFIDANNSKLVRVTLY